MDGNRVHAPSAIHVWPRVMGLTLVGLSLAACTAASDPARAARPAEASAANADAGSASDRATASSAPAEITKLAFVESPSGPRVLVAGTDPDERLESVWLDLLDERGEPAAIDPEGDGVTEPSTLEILIGPADRVGLGFFLEVQGSAGLERFVRSVEATAQDRVGARGQTWSAALGPLAVRGAGEACDARGFDLCAEGLACAAGRCEDLVTARARRCASAPVVAVGSKERGVAAGESLWDPQDGCASEARRGRPEGVVRLHVGAHTPSLTLATLAGGTAFDSVITILDSCGPASMALACNDDDPPPVSRVTLTDVAPGDYIVIIDSLDRSGGSYELAVTAP